MALVPTSRTPTHPGEMLLEEFLNPMGLTQRELADAIHVPYQRINDLVNGRRAIAHTLKWDWAGAGMVIDNPHWQPKKEVG